MLEYNALFGVRSSLREALSSLLAEGSWLYSWLAYMMSISNSNWGVWEGTDKRPPGRWFAGRYFSSSDVTGASLGSLERWRVPTWEKSA